MKSSSQRIEPVKKVAEQREKKAADTLSRAQNVYGEAQSKLHELVQYRSDYMSEFQFRAQRGMSGSQLQHYKSFLLQLDKAIETQKQQIELLQGEVNKQRSQWQSRSQRTQAVSKYQQRVQKKEQLNKDKAENRQIEDDINNLRHSKQS
ncbi:flagellar export protein FliJ [Pleionea mediterranea]|uniref:Flagellar FliJ protein n=1 Tax=Pleionea mediterranea TaxID=523701 RepID=A0A316FNA0_9GAMM|nr:flagellar export protein FliJ [Pleionea mediterranea]PWK49156.1 flagellar FliJ protein [Pleionea mediterranea]